MIERFATRAFRGKRPSADYLDRLVALFEMRRRDWATRSTRRSRMPLSVVLASPGFLYLREPSVEEGHRRLDGFELASAAVVFPLERPAGRRAAALARSDDLQKPAVLAAQVDRMIADDRSRAIRLGLYAPVAGHGPARLLPVRLPAPSRLRRQHQGRRARRGLSNRGLPAARKPQPAPPVEVRLRGDQRLAGQLLRTRWRKRRRISQGVASRRFAARRPAGHGGDPGDGKQRPIHQPCRAWRLGPAQAAPRPAPARRRPTSRNSPGSKASC